MSATKKKKSKMENYVNEERQKQKKIENWSEVYTKTKKEKKLKEIVPFKKENRNIERIDNETNKQGKRSVLRKTKYIKEKIKGKKRKILCVMKKK